MIFFKLTNPEEGRWDKVKEDFEEDLREIEKRFRKVDKDIFDQSFISQDAKKRSEAEENLKKLLASTTYARDMITKVQINHLSDLNKEIIEEIEMVARKIFFAVDVAMAIAHDIGGMLWDTNYRAFMLDAPLQQIEAQTNSKIAAIKEDNQEEREKIFNEGEQRKQQVIQKAMSERETFAQGYVNQLLAIGRTEIENMIRETAMKEISKEKDQNVENAEKETITKEDDNKN